MARSMRRMVTACSALVALSSAGEHSAGVQIPTHEIASGVRMPVVSIGTGGTERSAAESIVRDWLGLGGRGVDTALIYQDQDVVAKAIEEAGVRRSDLFITSKVPGCSMVKQSVMADLRALNTSYLDLLLIHFPRAGDCAVAWGILEDLHSQGLLRAIGLSNFKRADLEPVLKVAKVVPAVNQIELNVLSHDDDTIAFSRANNITIEAYSPLGRDSGKIPANPTIRSVASSHNVTTFQVAMRWILQHGHLLTFQSSSAAHQQQDADVFGFQLTDAEMATLDALQQATGPEDDDEVLRRTVHA